MEPRTPCVRTKSISFCRILVQFGKELFTECRTGLSFTKVGSVTGVFYLGA
jgi:hypothetical protein